MITFFLCGHELPSLLPFSTMTHLRVVVITTRWVLILNHSSIITPATSIVIIINTMNSALTKTKSAVVAFGRRNANRATTSSAAAAAAVASPADPRWTMLHPEMDAARMTHRRITVTVPSQHRPQSAFLLTAFSSSSSQHQQHQWQRRAFHSTLYRTTAEGKAQKEMMEDAKTLDPSDGHAKGTATVSILEGVEDEPLHAPYLDDTDGNVPKHPLKDLKGDPSDYTVPVVVKMPDVLDSDEEHNTIEKWYKEPGDVIKRNDLLCDIATPAFTFGMVTEDEEDAIMGEIHVAEGGMAPDDAPICTIYHLPAEKEKEKPKPES
jgi:hypothetical protein